MAKKREDYVKELQELAPKFVVNADHNISDLKEFIALYKSKAENATLKEQNKRLKAEKETAEKNVLELNEQLTASEAAKGSSKPVITIGSKHYMVMHGITLGEKAGEHKGTHSAKEIAENGKLAAYLLKRKSSAIQLIVKSE